MPLLSSLSNSYSSIGCQFTFAFLLEVFPDLQAWVRGSSHVPPIILLIAHLKALPVEMFTSQLDSELWIPWSQNLCPSCTSGTWERLNKCGTKQCIMLSINQSNPHKGALILLKSKSSWKFATTEQQAKGYFLSMLSIMGKWIGSEWDRSGFNSQLCHSLAGWPETSSFSLSKSQFPQIQM